MADTQCIEATMTHRFEQGRMRHVGDRIRCTCGAMQAWLATEGVMVELGGVRAVMPLGPHEVVADAR